MNCGGQLAILSLLLLSLSSPPPSLSLFLSLSFSLSLSKGHHLLLKEYFCSRDWQVCPLLLEFPLLPDPLLVELFNMKRTEKNLGLSLDIHYCWISVTLGPGIAGFNCISITG